MRQTTIRNITKVDEAAKQILDISAVAFFSALMIWLVWVIIDNHIEIPASVDVAVTTVFKVAVGVALCVFIVSVVVKMILSLFVKSDEESEYKAKVDYVLQQQTSATTQPCYADADTCANLSADGDNGAHAKKRVGQEAEVVSVLVGLSAEQEDVICRLLRELPAHINNPKKINMAEMSHYLTALRDLGYLNDNNMYNLYAWVEKITGRELPQYNHFNEAYPSTTIKKVNRAKEKITSELQKLR